MHGRLLAAVACLALALPASAAAVTFYATDGAKLVTFDETGTLLGAPPDLQTGAGPIALMALESDPRTGRLYGLDATTLYEIDPDTGIATGHALTGRLGGANSYGAAFDRDGTLRVVGDDATQMAVDVAAHTVGPPSSLMQGGVLPIPAVGITDVGSTDAYTADGALFGARFAPNELVTIARGTGTVAGTPLTTMPLTRYGFAVTSATRGFLTTSRVADTDQLHPVDLRTGAVDPAVAIGGPDPLNLLALTRAFDVVGMDAPALTVREGDPIALTATRTAPLAAALTVPWTATGGAAGTVAWPAAAGGTRTITVPNPQNDVDEPDRTVTVRLGPADGVASPSATTTVTIVDDDPPPAVQPPAPPPAPPARTTPLTPPPAVNRAPRLTVPALSSRRLRDLTTRRGLEVKVRTNEACRLTAELRIPRPTAKALKIGVRIARARAELRANRRTSLRLRPVVQIRNKLRTLRSVRATVWLTCADSRGAADPPRTVATTLRR
jgi:hypothetical protein